MIAKTEEDFNGLKEIGGICGAIRDEMVQATKPESPQKNWMTSRRSFSKKPERNLHQKANTISRGIRASA